MLIAMLVYVMLSQRTDEPIAFGESGAVLFLLDPCVAALCFWPTIIGAERFQELPAWIQGQAGPFGPNCYKLVELLVVLLINPASLALWPSSSSPTSGDPSAYVHLKSLSGGSDIGAAAIVCAILFVLCAGTAVVLEIWSTYLKSTGKHTGVKEMVRDTGSSSDGKGLSATPIATLVSLSLFAVGNALCEEAVSRGLFFAELQATGLYNDNIVNVIQSVSFGAAHWHGIPSGYVRHPRCALLSVCKLTTIYVTMMTIVIGCVHCHNFVLRWAGVALTFVYGLLMGALRMFGQGLLLPVLCHAVADFFLFAVVARKRFE
jgi:membrane protease YdiL (CAAX protease family)